jgi:hypothetical protein
MTPRTRNNVWIYKILLITLLIIHLFKHEWANKIIAKLKYDVNLQCGHGIPESKEKHSSTKYVSFRDSSVKKNAVSLNKFAYTSIVLWSLHMRSPKYRMIWTFDVARNKKRTHINKTWKILQLHIGSYGHFNQVFLAPRDILKAFKASLHMAQQSVDYDVKRWHP